MLLSFIIATYQNEHSLPKAVSCLLEICSTRGFAYEIIVVDNSATDAYIAPLIQLNDPHIRLFKNAKRGAHYSRMMGLQQATGQLIVVVDDDNYLTGEYIDFIVDKAKEKVQHFIGCANQEYHLTDWAMLGLNPHNYACGSLEGTTFLGNIPVYWGAGSVLSRSLANKIFQTDMIVEGRKAKRGYLMSGEDHEISLRAHLHQATFSYYTGIGLYHDIDRTRLNPVYYQQLNTGLVYAFWLLRPYYFLSRQSRLVSQKWLWILYNLVCATGYLVKHPTQYASRLIVKDALRLKEKLRQLRIISKYQQHGVL